MVTLSETVYHKWHNINIIFRHKTDNNRTLVVYILAEDNKDYIQLQEFLPGQESCKSSGGKLR